MRTTVVRAAGSGAAGLGARALPAHPESTATAHAKFARRRVTTDPGNESARRVSPPGRGVQRAPASVHDFEGQRGADRTTHRAQRQVRLVEAGDTPLDRGAKAGVALRGRAALEDQRVALQPVAADLALQQLEDL